MQPTDKDTAVPDKTDPTKAVQAATIIVLRDTPHHHNKGFEVFMVRRHHRSGFMANMYVYPGGKIHPLDCSEHAQHYIHGMTEHQKPLRGLYFAGIRETFEEAGILLAYPQNSTDFVDLIAHDDIAQRYQNYRQQLIREELALSELLARENLVVRFDQIGLFAHWITPYAEKRRFDTRFFVALAPPAQKPLHDTVETTASTWITPAKAIDDYRQGNFALAPPTLRTLEQLGEFDSAESVLEYAKTYQPPVILPHFTRLKDKLYLLLPGDPEFPRGAAAYTIAQPVDDNITRMVLDNNEQWHSLSGVSSK